MIHTFTIQHQFHDFTLVRRIAECLNMSREKIDVFMSWRGQAEERGNNVLKGDELSIPGYQEIKLVHLRCWNRAARRDFSQYYIYIKLEPLTVINREKHIALFECTDANLRRLIENFRTDMLALWAGNGEVTENAELAELIDFTTWDAQRVDYTIDVHMRNHDEVLAYMNLAKMSALSNCITAAEYTSIYGENFKNHTYKYGNKSWELQIYDKEVQFAKKRDKYEPEHFQRLLAECRNIARIEYRRLTNGTKKASTTLASRNIMEFMREDLAQSWLMECYEKTIGFEDFYRAYHMEKLLDKAFPMNSVELREERRRAREANEAGDDGYKPERHSKKFYIYRDHLMDIASHKGMQNALNATLAGLSGTKRASARRKFTERNKAIRQRVGISPVLIPDAWKTKRLMDLPTDVLRNPIKPQN